MLFATHVEVSCEHEFAALEIQNESFDETTECIFKCEKIKTLKMLIVLARSPRHSHAAKQINNDARAC